MAKSDEKKANKVINPSEEPVFSWEAEEFPIYQKGNVWTLLVIGSALALIAVFIWLKNWTGIALAVAAAAALISQGHSKPKKVQCVVFQGGIVVNNKPYNFADLKSFWTLETPYPAVRIEKASRLSMPLTVPLGNFDPEQVRLYLSKRLPEHEDRGEDVSDLVGRWLKF